MSVFLTKFDYSIKTSTIMKLRKITLTVFAIASLMVIQSCSTGSDLAQRKYSQRNYVKAETKQAPSTKMDREVTKVEIQKSEIPSVSVSIPKSELRLAYKAFTQSSDNSFKATEKLINQYARKADINENVDKEAVKKAAQVILDYKATDETSDGGVPEWLLYVLCLFIPPLAVGLKTDWETKPLIINILLCLLCGIPGVIHAFLVVADAI